MPDFGQFDLGRAFWALALSLALWLVVQADLNPERSDVFELTLEPRNLPSGLVVTNQAEWRPVQVLAAAPRDVFAQLRASQIHAYVDLSQAGPGEAPFPVVIPSPDAQVRIGEPNPRRITVRLEELTRKTIPVRARLDGNPPFGYRAGRPTVSPESVAVSGPASFVRRVEAAEADVRLDSVTADVDLALVPSLVNAQGEKVLATLPSTDVQPGTVRVQLPIAQQVSYKEVGVRPTLRGTTPAGYWVQTVALDPAVVTVIGEPQLLAGVDALETEPVDLSGLTTSFSRGVGLDTPAGLALARSEPLTLSVQILPLPVEQSLRLPVAVQNLGSQVVLGSALPVVDVVVTGPADRGLGPTDVAVSVDAGGLETGSYSLDVRVRLPDRYQLVSVRPGVVSLVLNEAGRPVAEPTPAPPPTVAPTPEPAPPTATPVPALTETVAPSPTITPSATETPRTAAPTPTTTRSPSPPPRSPTPTGLPRTPTVSARSGAGGG